MAVGYIAPPVTFGHEDEAEALLKRLVGGPRQLGVVPIVGMPGLGKTTLATKLYSHEIVMGHYDARSWCCISQVYERKKVLLEIRRGLDKKNTKTQQSDEESHEESELADELRKLLIGKRYLIVVDDLWSTNAWDDLRPIFPDDNKGSRLVITTRLDEVAFYASTDPHHLRNLTKDESWELLKKIVFKEECSPSELEEVGKEIATSCSGLPLAIVLTAGLLDRGEKEVGYWKELAQNLSSNLFRDAKWLMEIIELSYKTLPHDLKPCFLYFGAFSEDEQIPITKLIQLWTYEGLIPHNELMKSMDHLATSYLMDLVGRNLVMVGERSDLGVPEAVQVHDLLHQFCTEKAKEEIYLQRFYGSKLTPEYDYPQFASHMPSRLVVCSEAHNFIKWNSPCEGIRSVRFIVSDSMQSAKPFDDFIQAFKLLTVLDLKKVDFGNSFPHGILQLIHLRYFEIKGSFDEVPSNISCLINLETLLIDSAGSHSKEIRLPNTIWDMVNLRHLGVHGWFPDFGEISQQFSKLEKLETCEGLMINLPENLPILTHGIPNVVKYSCTMHEYDSDSDSEPDDKLYYEDFDSDFIAEVFAEYSGDEDIDDLFFHRDDADDSRLHEPLFRSLDRLESLACYCEPRRPPTGRAFGFPTSLKKLELGFFPFRNPLRSVSTIGELPNLEILHLLYCYFWMYMWIVKDGEFPKLKVLRMFHTDSIRWRVSEDAFPNLQLVSLEYCRDLDIPSNFGYLNSLKLLEVSHCGEYTSESAMRIKEIQVEELANSDFKLKSDHTSSHEESSDEEEDS